LNFSNNFLAKSIPLKEHVIREFIENKIMKEQLFSHETSCENRHLLELVTVEVSTECQVEIDNNYHLYSNDISDIILARLLNETSIYFQNNYSDINNR
jgi:hypothetical protein